MKSCLLFLPLFLAGASFDRAQADFSGSTLTLNSPNSLYITSSGVTVSNVVIGTYSSATLVISNAAASPIPVNWAGPGRAVGVGTTNQFYLSGGQIAQINVNAAIPSMIIYNTLLEQFPPVNTAPVGPPAPDLLYYALTEGANAYQLYGNYYETPPVYLADSSTHGGSTGSVTATVPIQWVPNQNGTFASALHFNGSSTKLQAGNSTLFNFTTNLFTVNIWVRNLTYPCALCGNGLYLNYGWYVAVNPAGEIVAAAENPGFDNVVATTSTVAFAGQWAMITVVRTSPTTILIYRDGLLQNTTGTFGNPTPSSSPLTFGDDYVGNQYDGDLGTIRIYSHPLSASQITTLYLNDTAL